MLSGTGWGVPYWACECWNISSSTRVPEDGQLPSSSSFSQPSEEFRQPPDVVASRPHTVLARGKSNLIDLI